MDENNSMTYEEILMTKVSWCYYIEGLTQQAIAERLGLQRIKVVKILEQARKYGVVQFNFWPNNTKRMELEQDLIKKFNLKDVIIIPTPGKKSEINESIARAASMYIFNRLPADGYINIGYGDTPGKVLNNLASMTENTLKCISLTGGVNYYLPDTRSTVFNAKLHLIPAPLIISSEEMATAIKNESSIQTINKMIKLSGLSVVGIGGMNDEATILSSNILNKDDFTMLRRQGAVGDLLCHFINAEGKTVDSSIDKRLISTSLNELKKLSNVIGVAGGLEKVEAIKGVLKGQYIDVLISDEDTGNELLQ